MPYYKIQLSVRFEGLSLWPNLTDIRIDAHPLRRGEVPPQTRYVQEPLLFDLRRPRGTEFAAAPSDPHLSHGTAALKSKLRPRHPTMPKTMPTPRIDGMRPASTDQPVLGLNFLIKNNLS